MRTPIRFLFMAMAIAALAAAVAVAQNQDLSDRPDQDDKGVPTTSTRSKVRAE